MSYKTSVLEKQKRIDKGREYAEQQITDTVLSICQALTLISKHSPWELTSENKPNCFEIPYISGISKISGCPAIKKHRDPHSNEFLFSRFLPMKEIHSCLCKIDFNNVSATKCQPNICNSFSFLPVKKKDLYCINH